MIRIIQGNALQFSESPGWNILAHVVNDCGAFGAGFALQLAKKWPETKRHYIYWRHSSTFKLGNIEIQTIRMGLSVAHLLCQVGLPGVDNPEPLHYGHMASCLKKLGLVAVESGATIHAPRLGCGLARGKWFCVAALLEKCIPSAVPINIYVPQCEVKK